MAVTYPFSLITLEGHKFDGPVVSVSAQGEHGRFGILAGHAQMVAGLVPGLLEVKTESDTQYFVTFQGVCEVRKDHTVLLAQKAQPVSGPDEANQLLADA